jgi:hypothetical protein
MLAICACSSEPKEAPKQEVRSLTQNLNLVDQENRLYGRVEMTPVGGGKVYDSSGQLIGKIVPITKDND